ncbi:trypsin alpha-4-like [Helicoverpa zea]|uniref:trypsin alpha-4-like n=1 Tax=Helicoverpa zea TaxID=7113 RepID=UPI001F5896F3|nr:trypsin alpha-4-like [Helicoverpa zea]
MSNPIDRATIDHFIYSKCFNHEETFEQKNDSSEEVDDALFAPNMVWNPGDIPLLNRKIFKGVRVAIREHPYIASIRRHIMHYSVATILTKNLFITVAHPLVDVPLNELSIVVGENYADRGATLLTVMLVIIHEQFDRFSLNGDVALIRGRELCLPRSGKYTPGEKFDPMLRFVSFMISVPNPYCDGYKKNGVILKPGMLCVGKSRKEDNVTSCLAVPGAPLVVGGHLTGLLSWGYGCGYVNDLPLVYTNMQYYQPWLLHNIPLIRRITKQNLTLLFQLKRAHILTTWLNLTRVVKPVPFTLSDEPMETLKLDRELAKLKGRVYDIRDFIFRGMHRKYKKRLYEKLKDRIAEKEAIKKIHEASEITSSAPFLDPDNLFQTTKQGTGLTFMEQTQPFATDGDNAYYEDYAGA